MKKKNKNVFVIPSWYPPHGGSFFKEQVKALNEISDQTVLYAHPISIKNILFSPKKYFSQLFKIKKLKTDGFCELRMYYIRIPKLLKLNLYLQYIVIENFL